MSTLSGAEIFFNKNEILLEIGPGLGMVTEYFTRLGYSLLLVEKDPFLVNYLKQKYPQHQIVCADFLELKRDFFTQQKITQIISNLPFYITTPILEKIVSDLKEVKIALLGMQKEVALRIVQEKGSSLSFFLRFSGKSKIFRYVSKNAFYPTPEVDVAWLLWERNKEEGPICNFELLLRAIFWGKRKPIKNSLQKNPFFAKSPLAHHIIPKIPEILKNPQFSEILLKRSDELSFTEVQALFSFLFGDIARH